MQEACSIFEELSPKGWLAFKQRKQLCHFCFWYSDSQPCPPNSLLACPVQGCMGMYHKLLHDALQGEEVRAIVIEVEPEPEEEEEEFYAANFEDLGQDYSDEDEGEESGRETQTLVDSEEERPCLCQQRGTELSSRCTHCMTWGLPSPW